MTGVRFEAPDKIRVKLPLAKEMSWRSRYMGTAVQYSPPIEQNSMNISTTQIP